MIVDENGHVIDPNDLLAHLTCQDGFGREHRITYINPVSWSCGDRVLEIQCFCGGAYSWTVAMGLDPCGHHHSAGHQEIDALHRSLFLLDASQPEQPVHPQAERIVGWMRN